MSNVIPLHDGPHQALRHLLPWHANGSLDAIEAARVEAHLASCPTCRAELAAEYRLKREVTDLPADISGSWAALRERIVAAEAIPVARRPRRFAWLLVAQAAALVVATGFALQRPAADVAPRYHALGSAPVASGGNVIVLFRPDTSEARMREALRVADARLVGGPTEANAYLLHVDPERRLAAVARLRALPAISLAQPIDESPSS